MDCKAFTSFSACRVQLHQYNTYVPYRIHRASVPVRYIYTSNHTIGHTAFTECHCLYCTDKSLFILCAIQTLLSLIACRIPLNFYTPMGRTPFTSLQFLYSTAIPILELSAVEFLQSLSVCKILL